MFNSRDEVALDTLDLSDLVMQFKLMQKLGYKSLFDPNFRRELKNPYRKQLYYRIMVTEEALESKKYVDISNYISDKISFFSDPELFKKVKQKEEEMELSDPETHAEKERQILAKYGRPKAPNKSEQDRDIEFLKKARPTRSLMG